MKSMAVFLDQEGVTAQVYVQEQLFVQANVTSDLELLVKRELNQDQRLEDLTTWPRLP